MITTFPRLEKSYPKAILYKKNLSMIRREENQTIYLQSNWIDQLSRFLNGNAMIIITEPEITVISCLQAEK